MARTASGDSGTSLCSRLGYSRARLNQPAPPCRPVAVWANSCRMAGWVLLPASRLVVEATSRMSCVGMFLERSTTPCGITTGVR
ncbi:hypothetical protein FQZ97_1234150 [compost metagenome]